MQWESWRGREREHQARADALTARWRARQQSGSKHPVDDFLFTYYPVRPATLRRWHPGAGVTLEGAATKERAAWKWYLVEGDDVRVDTAALLAQRESSIRFIVSLLQKTATRQANFGCFGLHEWAMVYRSDETRHEVPLRLGGAGTNEVVEGHRIACSHFDAFRFFTPEAVSRNRLVPSRDNQPELEQPGCLHAGMDVYKWVTKLGPLVPGEVLLDAFELARDIRQLDMRASPYDLREWGYQPVTIETPEGKAEYVREQRGFAERGNALRERVIAAVVPLLG
ncbi:3-methyladenine DNA glycosylase [Salinibacterium sp. dk2585]|nr:MULTISPECIES: 3-methyladenine DNA glycosylase [unclassified Salinibacterium]QEE62700.1 3-methyladenine DNA glycosylase [Salinibacterium sp. dk2585]TXK53696.1 3-methyladenine DNA glycosylase [Salinibacterium sp. dk5596]